MHVRRGLKIGTQPNETILNKATIRWSLSKLAPVAETDWYWVYRVQREDNSRAALRIFKSPDGTAERAGNLLEWYGGDGAVRHYGSTPECLLTEWVEGTTLAEPSRDGKDAQAMSAIANLVGMLHVHRPAPPENLIDLREHFKDFFSADVRFWPDTARDLFARSVGIAYSVFDKPHAQIPLHGNVYHEGVFMAERGWIADAPVGLLGDPAYDLAPGFLHPWGDVKLAANPKRINAMADVYAEKLGLRRKRILAFAAIHAADSACTALAAGESINWQLAVLPNLLAVYDAAD